MSDPADCARLPWEHPLGATPAGDGRVRFRVWATGAAPSIRLDGADRPMDPVGGDVWELEAHASHGTDYWVVLDGTAWPDPCSRWQPEGIRGPSRVVDPAALADTGARPAIDPARQVISEIHVGTFTEAGTFDAAIE